MSWQRLSELIVWICGRGRAGEGQPTPTRTREERESEKEETHVLDDGRHELVEGEERVRADAGHEAQLLLVRLLVDVAVEQFLGEVEHVLVVVLGRVVARVDDGDGRRQAELDAERVEPARASGRGGELGRELLEGEEAVVDLLRASAHVGSALGCRHAVERERENVRGDARA